MENESVLTFQKFVEWGFLTIISAGVGWVAVFLGKLTKNIHNLNLTLTTLVERTLWHQREIENHEERLTTLERLKRRT